MAISKKTLQALIRLGKWTSIIRLIAEGEVDMPLKFKYEKYLSFKAVCLRETKNHKSVFKYIPHYFGGNVMVIKTRKDESELAEPIKQSMQAKRALHKEDVCSDAWNKPPHS